MNPFIIFYKEIPDDRISVAKEDFMKLLHRAQSVTATEGEPWTPRIGELVHYYDFERHGIRRLGEYQGESEDPKFPFKVNGCSWARVAKCDNPLIVQFTPWDGDDICPPDLRQGDTWLVLKRNGCITASDRPANIGIWDQSESTNSDHDVIGYKKLERP